MKVFHIFKEMLLTTSYKVRETGTFVTDARAGHTQYRKAFVRKLETGLSQVLMEQITKSGEHGLVHRVVENWFRKLHFGIEPLSVVVKDAVYGY